ncbi:S-layer homology domain-containing protein [Deinococcus sp. VB343]|uniref:S-layer homology domain-containing protein n=1 Tax=Deinococcus sp. VB343 TaxID=3385567 RepID=UPI0039C9CC88
MKKSLLALTTALSFGFAAAQTAAPVSAPQVPALTDVPAGHWAKDAIDRLVSRGIILGYPDGTFRGTQNLTRYEAAIIIARLLDQVRSGEAPEMNQEDMTALQNAIQELAADLAALGVRVSDLEANAVSKDDFARLEARIEEVATASGEAGATEALQGQIDELTARVDEYDALRADVDDNASSIAALNDLTVLLNQDILDLQDRVSAVESAQADFVQRSDFDALAGRVGVVETRVESVNNSLTGRIAALERNAFSIKPTLTVGYSVSRANRNFDVDRLFPLNADGTTAANAFSGNQSDDDTGERGRDFGDFGGSTSAVVAGADGLYGFAAKAGPVYQEGRTSISLGLTFGNSGQFNQVTSASGGSLFSTTGKLSVNKIDVDFGLVTSLPSSAYVDTNGNGKQDSGEATGRNQYPGSGGVTVRDGDGYYYSPVFFKFKNATTEFSVGNNPVIVTIGRNQKFFFTDYVFDNDKKSGGRGDGFKVAVDGSNLPVIGAWKPQILGVYGSRNGNRDIVVTRDAAGKETNVYGESYGVYYRGVRAEITPIGSLKLGLNYAQEGRDQAGATVGAGQTALAQYQAPTDVTAFSADAHGKVAGVEVHSEYATSRVNPYDTAANKGDAFNTSAFYARIATRKADKTYDLNTPAASFGTDMFKFDLYDLNFRRIDANYDYVSGISEAGYDNFDVDNTRIKTAAQNLPWSNDGKVTAPFANLVRGFTKDAAGNYVLDTVGQQGFGVKAAVTLGPVAVGGYYDSSKGLEGTAADQNAMAMTEMGGSVKLAYNVFSVRGSYNVLDSARKQVFSGSADGGSSVKVTRTAVQADVTPGRGFFVGAYYRDIALAKDGGNSTRVGTDRGLLSRGYLLSSFAPGVGKNAYRTGLGCAENNAGVDYKDTDGVGNVLNPSVNLDASRASTCFTAYGVEAGHAGDADNALVKDLFFRVGYGRLYNDATSNFDGNLVYGDARYDRKVGVANVRVAGSFANSSIALSSTRPAGTRAGFGVIVRTDPLAGLPFRPQLNGQFGYYTAVNGVDANKYSASATKYGAGVVLNDFLLPETKIGVRYDGYTAQNRQYTPFDGSGTQGYFSDSNNNRRTNLNGVYVEGAYQDLVFSYGVYNLSQKDMTSGVEYGSGLGDGKAAKGQTFKISYKVNF